jgi:glucose-6-phosphate isomerase
MSTPSNPALTYQYDGALLPATGLQSGDLEALAPWLQKARQEVLDDLALWHDVMAGKKKVPDHKVPLDAGFIDLPERLLAEYRANPEKSELGRIRACADRLAGLTDRVVVLGIGGSYMGARALFEALRSPFHNELGRPGRNGRPRLYFEGNNVDNWAVRQLLDLLAQKDERPWGIVVISKSGTTLETAAAFRVLLRELEKQYPKQVAELVVPITGEKGSRLRALNDALKCRDVFPVPDGVGGRFSVLSAVGLLPAAVLGIDVVRLLEGAAAMNDAFRKAAVGANPVLDYTGVSHLLEARRGATIRVLSTWGKRLEAFGLWYDQLLSESLGKAEHGATPVTVVNTRDLHSRGQQHQEGRRDKLVTNLVVDPAATTDPIAVGTSNRNEDDLNKLADKTLPQILDAAFRGTNQAYWEGLRPTATLRLPGIDEAVLGQLFQMFMLATAVEGRLIGINPYGQPGVEVYKKNMNEILRGK